jgi:hypothetical protein
MVIWYLVEFFRFYVFYQEKSGNPGQGERRLTLYRNGHFFKTSEKVSLRYAYIQKISPIATV